MRNGLFMFCVVACGPKTTPAPACEGRCGAPGPAALVALASASGSNVTGQLQVVEKDGGLWLVGSISGLAPGAHGFHIHEKGDCSAADATSAGPHFDPTQSAHGAPGGAAHHGGDLGNLEVTTDPHEVAVALPGLTLTPGEHSILGRSVIVHANADDFTSQPAGNAGARIACGIIQSAAAE